MFNREIYLVETVRMFTLHYETTIAEGFFETKAQARAYAKQFTETHKIKCRVRKVQADDFAIEFVRSHSADMPSVISKPVQAPELVEIASALLADVRPDLCFSATQFYKTALFQRMIGAPSTDNTNSENSNNSNSNNEAGWFNA